MSTNTVLRVVIVDDHTIVRGGLASFFRLSPDFDLVAEFGNGKDIVEKIDALEPDVVLMDLFMPIMDGFTATRLIHERKPELPILVLTSVTDEELIQRALQAGAVGYLLKTTDTDELADAIQTVCRGESYLVAEATKMVMRRVVEREKLQLGHDLTKREREVLQLIVKGLTNRQIADHLSVSLPTVKFHVGNILSKLHVNSRTEAVITALDNNLHIVTDAIPGHRVYG